MTKPAHHTLEPLRLTALIPPEFAGLRVDHAIVKLFPDYSRSRLQAWMRDKQLTVDGRTPKSHEKVKGGENIALNTYLSKQDLWVPQEITLNIVHEDASLLIINKPVGLVVHPAAGHWEGTLVNALLHYLPELDTLPRAGIIHRLDKDTSGLLVIAKTLQAHTSLTKQLQARTMRRTYQAIVRGVFTGGGTINQPIGRDPKHRKRMAVILNGKPAITHYRVLERFQGHTLITVHLDTGRTHQIRVHMAYIHHPVIGDMTYGGRLQVPPGITAELLTLLREFKRQALHATQLGFVHPTLETQVEWSIPLPPDIQQLLDTLRHDQTHRP